MKNIVITFVIFASVPVFAGKMKEIWSMTQESVIETLGFDEDAIKFESIDFIQVIGADLAVQTIARSYYSVTDVPPTYKCVTIFKKFEDQYSVLNTKCMEAP